MPRITKISRQKRNRVNIFLDGEFAFGLDLESYIRLGLKVGQDLSSQQTVKLKGKSEFQKIFEKLLNFAVLRPRSYKEIESWLRGKKVSKFLWEKSVKKLEKMGMLNDKHFAEWWIEQRREFRPRSKKVLYGELFKKGIDRNIINEVIEKSGIDEVSQAVKDLDKRRYKWSAYKDNFVRKQKQKEYLVRKGYSWEAATKAVENKKG